MFFAADKERGPRLRQREARAKAVCASCVVVEECLRWALEVRESYGVWGGLSVDERERLLLQLSA
jgi:WhiB family redox-sensing transcriptional regulator